MSRLTLSEGLVHAPPGDLVEAFNKVEGATVLWNAITPIARNEFLCWVENAKQLETRNKRIARVGKELKEGMRRPCCWIGCIHRTDKEISPSVKYVLSRKSKKN